MIEKALERIRHVLQAQERQALALAAEPERPIVCHLDDCDSTNTMACESCGNHVCHDHGQTDSVSGAWFCGLKDNASALAKEGRFDEVTYCATYCPECGAAELETCDSCDAVRCMDCLTKSGGELVCSSCLTAREGK